MKNIISLILILVFSCLITCVCADTPTKIKTDPKKTEESALAYSDARLNQKVTYIAENKPVREVLSDLKTMTGVDFHSGINSKDWLVRDRKLIIFVKDVPLGSLRASIARVLKMKWIEFGDDKKLSYRLYQDKKTLIDEEERQNKAIESARLEHNQKSKETLDNMIYAANLSPNELESIKEKEPYLYLLGTTGIASAVKTLADEVPGAKSAFLGGEPVIIYGSQFTPNLKRNMTKALDGVGFVYSRVLKRDSKFISGLKNSDSNIYIEISNSFSYDYINRRSNSSPISLNIGKKILSLPFVSQPDISNVFASGILKCAEQPDNLINVLKDAYFEFIIASNSDESKLDTGEQPVEHTDDPALLKEIQVKDRYDKLREYLAALFYEGNVNIVSDSFGTNGLIRVYKPELNIIPSQKASIKKYLETIGSTSNTNWEKNDSIVEFRNREWFNKTAYLIPDAVINPWKEKLITTGTLDINQLSQMAKLDQNQMDVNIFSDELLNNSNVSMNYAGITLSVLRCYTDMTNQQRNDFFSGTGINIKTVGEKGLNYSRRFLSIITDEIINTNNAIYLSCLVEPAEGCYQYTFIFRNDESKILGTREIVSPVYKPVVDKPKPWDKKVNKS